MPQNRGRMHDGRQDGTTGQGSHYINPMCPHAATCSPLKQVVEPVQQAGSTRQRASPQEPRTREFSIPRVFQQDRDSPNMYGPEPFSDKRCRRLEQPSPLAKLNPPGMRK